MKILKFKKQSKDKYMLYLDDNSKITLYEDVIIKNNLLITKQIDKKLLDIIEKENNDRKSYILAVNYISIKMRSNKEIKEYLIKKGFSNENIDKQINQLIADGYLNDEKFTISFINDNINLTNKGPLKIKNELIKYGINNDIIEEKINLIDDDIVKDKLNNLIDKQLRIKKGSENAIKIKLINYFINLGYSKDMIITLLSNKKISSDKNKIKKDYEKLYNKYKVKYNEEELLYFISQKLYSKGYTACDIKEIILEEKERPK